MPEDSPSDRTSWSLPSSLTGFRVFSYALMILVFALLIGLFYALNLVTDYRAQRHPTAEKLKPLRTPALGNRKLLVSPPAAAPAAKIKPPIPVPANSAAEAPPQP